MRPLALISGLALGCTPVTEEGLNESFEAEGLTAQAGLTTDFHIEDCEFLERCFGNNASAPYLLLNLPGHPDDPGLLPPNTVGQIPRVPDDLRSQYYLDENEAVAVLGQTPPTSRYFGFTPYLFSRIDGAGERIPVFASLTDTLNPVTIKAGDSGPFDSPFAIVYASDADTVAATTAALRRQGYTDDNINVVVLPREGMLHGFDETASDTFLMMGRIALIDDDQEEADYLSSLPLSVFRLTPKQTGNALDVLPRTPRGDGTTEDHLRDGLDALEEAITAATSASEIVTPISIASSALVAAIIDPAACIENVTECKGDNTDTTYAAGPLDVIQAGGTNTLAEDEHFIIYGVNHAAAGKATYANFSVYTQQQRVGVAAVDSDEMTGSADAYIPDHPDRDQYFVFEVRRDCADRAHCLTLDTAFPGAALDESVFFIFRAYMNPSHSVSPDHDEILTERVFHVSPKAR